MNLIFKYVRKTCGNSRYRLLKHFMNLAIRNKKIISKYCQLIDVEEAYSRVCVKKLPLTFLYKKGLPSCNDSRTCSTKYYFDNIGNKWIDDDIRCLLCWINTLENIDRTIDKDANLPPFLQKKTKQATRPTSLLKKKELPSYLKK